MMFEQLQTLLEENDARFRVIEHPPEGKSDEVARIRGTEPGQGAKAMLCKGKGADDPFVLAILSGNKKLDFQKLANAVGLKKVTLAKPEDAMRETGCVIGAIPPFSFSGQIALVVDPSLLEDYAEIAFNAGRLDRSMVLDSQDYIRIAKPQLHSIAD